MKRSRLFVGLAVLAIGLIAGVTYAVAGKSGETPKQAQKRVARVHKTAAITAAEAGVVSELTRPQRASDAVPLVVRKQFAAGSPEGVNVDLARRVDIGSGDGAWLAPGTNSVCLITMDPSGPANGFGMQCRTPNDIAAGQLATEWVGGENPDAGASTIVGVAPDGTDAVDIRDADGSSAAVTVHHNVFVHRGGRARQLTMRTKQGVRHKRL